MNLFVLHAGQPELTEFLRLLRVPAGTVLPRFERGVSPGPSWVVVNFRGDDQISAEKLPPRVRVLQPAELLGQSAQRSYWLAALRRNGIRVMNERSDKQGVKLIRRYVVPVFQLEALGVFTQGSVAGPIGRQPTRGLTQWTEVSADEVRPAAVRRLERAAIRAVYALGLDYGVVRMITDESGMPVVYELELSPRSIGERFAVQTAGAVHRLEAELHSDALLGANSIMLGMDPEFVLRRPGPNGKIVPASKYFGRRGRVGCDSVRIGERLLYPLVELRPSPSADPEELFRNLYAAMLTAASRIDDASLEWLAGGMPAKGLPLGGHIHVSGVVLNADLLRAMDNYLALPLVLLEDSTTKGRRPRYGALGDFRRQFHGGFEYRTLPSWIVSPRIAMGVLALARIVCEHFRELRQRPLARPDLQTHYYEGNKESIRPWVMTLWADLERTASYSRYGKTLRRFKRLLERRETWDERSDVRREWKIPPFRNSSLPHRESSGMV